MQIKETQYDELIKYLHKLKSNQSVHQGSLLHVLGIVHNEIRLLLGYVFIVDRWPNFGVLLVRHDQVPIRCQQRNYSLLVVEMYAVRRLLEREDSIIWEPDIKFDYIPQALFELLSQIATRRGYKIEILRKSEVVVVQPTDTNDCIPDGLKLSSIQRSEATIISKQWPDLPENNWQYVEFLIRNFANICIRTTSESLVAYMLQQIDGSSGMLFVDEDYKNQGLEKQLILAMSSHLQEQNIPYYAALDTEEGIHLHNTVKSYQVNGFVYSLSVAEITSQ